MSDGKARFRPAARGAEFTLGNRIARAVFQLAWLGLARFTPPFLHSWRRLVLRTFGAKIGAGTRVYASVRIWLPGNLAIGSGCIIGPRVRLYNQGRITIGDDCVVSQDASLCASTHSPHDPAFALQLSPITIADQCWIAAEAFVGPGVSMGEGAVLGARGALFEDAEPVTIYRGNPAAPIGPRKLERR
ncbi:hypothetical protein [Paraurantiacibacter namhicola]|uniref:hypothetical protein n=1 Tax=Paraurantiacibacter namhicola TaxID=645517 RepID=UPI000830223C|nr:hypothetical protein [Paraurantiacibacter namhicola]